MWGGLSASVAMAMEMGSSRSDRGRLVGQPEERVDLEKELTWESSTS
jgi:hypothetical protein